MQQRSPLAVPGLTPGATPLPTSAGDSRRGIVVCAVILDCALIWLAFCSAYALRYSARWVPIIDRGTLPAPFQDWLPFGIMLSLIVFISLAVTGLYRSRLGRDLIDEMLVILRATLIAVGIVVIANSFLPVVQYSRLVIVYAWVILVLYLSLGKILFYAALGRLHGSGWHTRRVLVVGATPMGKMVMQNLLGKRDHGYHLVGFVQESRAGTVGAAVEQPPDVDTQAPVRAAAAPGYVGPGRTALSGSYPRPVRANFGRFTCLGGIEDLRSVVQDWSVDEVIVALPAIHHTEIAEVCAHCEAARVAVKMVPDLFEMSLSQVRMDHLAGIPLIDVHRAGHSRVALAIKRAMDIAIAGFFLLLLSPILLLTALAIKLDSPGPVLANQTRVGKGGRHFTFFKFRSMYRDADERLKALVAQRGLVDAKIFKDRRDPRRTRVGRIIRQLSLDEMPQLLNVLRGDMSLVGPRPPLPREVEHYEPHHFKRLSVIGGITGMWQVSGRSNIESFEEIIMMDTYYIDNWSLALDLKLLMRTVLAVLTRNGAY